MSNEASNQKKPAGPRVITLRLRLPVLILTLVLFAIGLTWIFMAGVLVGRGYSAREEIGVLASFMPSPQVAEPTGSASPEASDSAEASGIDSLFPADESSRKGAPADNPDGLLRGEDLAFKDSLTAPETPASAQTSQPRPAQPAQTVQPVPQTGAANARQTGTPQTGATDTVVYEYIYQVSSFSQLHQAQLLVQKLQDVGINAQIELHRLETGAWYRVLVSFRGQNSELEAFNARLKQFNLGTPMLRKKKAISG